MLTYRQLHARGKKVDDEDILGKVPAWYALSTARSGFASSLGVFVSSVGK